MSNKHQQLKEWLAANPGKASRDWLLEVRCVNNSDRETMSRLLDTLDNSGVTYDICHKHNNYYTDYQLAPLCNISEVWVDLLIAPGVGRSYIIEVDMPDNVLGQITDNIPETAFRWLLRKWAPDFDIAALDEKQYHKLMWEDMGGLLSPFIGEQGFPNWKAADFGGNVVTKYLKDKATVDAIAKDKLGL